jgi:hypothetical protein
MGQVYERVGRARDADACYVRAAGLEGSPWEARSVDLDIRVDALRRLALVRRRARRYQEAAWAWEALLESGADRETLQEARRALAIHHEHRTRDLESARAFAESAAGTEQDPDRVSDLRRRLDRLERKRLRGTAGRAIDT